MESVDYFTVTMTTAMDQDLFEIEMAKALEEIFTNLRQLKENRSDSRKLSMIIDKNELGEEFIQHVERTKNVDETNPEKETKSDKQDTNVIQVRPQAPRRRQLPVLPAVKKSL